MDIAAHKQRIWRHRSGLFRLGERTLVMGVVNITPDSFSDGGKFFDTGRAVERALELQEQGADLLDFGAESTRPGSDGVSACEQLRRLLPVLESLSGKIRIPVSVDTCSSEVAGECLQAGASIINDISGFHADSALPARCAHFDAGVVLMHMRGTPRTMQQNTNYDDLFGEINAFLSESVTIAEQAGVARERIMVDPGIGFGKSFEQNYLLLGELYRLRNLAAGVLAGPSRKRFTGEFSGLPAEQRQFPTAAAVSLAILHGADAIRVHDVTEMKQVTDIVDRFREVHESRT